MDTPACEEVNIDKQEQKHRDPASELIVSGRISKAVWFLAWPTIINTLFFTAYNLINRAFLGRIEDAAPALAAVGVGGVIMMTQQSVMFGVTAGTAALVSRFLGA
ncbi:MAG TPA: MATE family efflux transporter, partial [Armatimonadota bacterium]|nr:MATE family efflux transporter [Armatimonadota bacterium]